MTSPILLISTSFKQSQVKVMEIKEVPELDAVRNLKLVLIDFTRVKWRTLDFVQLPVQLIT